MLDGIGHVGLPRSCECAECPAPHFQIEVVQLPFLFVTLADLSTGGVRPPPLSTSQLTQTPRNKLQHLSHQSLQGRSETASSYVDCASCGPILTRSCPFQHHPLGEYNIALARQEIKLHLKTERQDPATKNCVSGPKVTALVAQG